MRKFTAESGVKTTLVFFPPTQKMHRRDVKIKEKYNYLYNFDQSKAFALII